MAIDHQYETRDLYESAYLFSVGIKLISTYKADNGIIFVFEDKHTCDALIKDYWNYNGLIIPKKFADSLKNLKELVHANSKF